jgi:hypothetical protein
MSTTTLTLIARNDHPTQLVVTPWPSRRERITLVYERRYLAETFSNEAMMREALKRTPWVTFQTTPFPDETECQI